MKLKPTYTEPEITNVIEGYYQYLEGKTISNRKAKKEFEKWLAEKIK